MRPDTKLKAISLFSGAGGMDLGVLQSGFEILSCIEIDQIFATARGYGEFKGWWEFPVGKIEAGETAREALKREIMEELATEIEVGKLIDTVEYDYPDFHLSMDCFWCRIVKGDLIFKIENLL